MTPLSVRTRGTEIRVSKRHLHPVVTAALFPVAKTRRLSNCPLADKWIKNVVCTHTEQCSVKKTVRAATWWTPRTSRRVKRTTQKDASRRPRSSRPLGQQRGRRGACRGRGGVALGRGLTACPSSGLRHGASGRQETLRGRVSCQVLSLRLSGKAGPPQRRLAGGSHPPFHPRSGAAALRGSVVATAHGQRFPLALERGAVS